MLPFFLLSSSSALLDFFGLAFFLSVDILTSCFSCATARAAAPFSESSFSLATKSGESSGRLTRDSRSLRGLTY